ncbi:MAG: alkane 1-monooxygenase [Bacteroidota bacterium]
MYRRLKSARYLLVFTLPVLVYVSFTNTGWLTFAPMMEAFVLIPLVELFLKPDPTNHEESEEPSLLSNKLYDMLVYLIVPIQWFFLIFFFNVITESHLTFLDQLGRWSAMGLMCGVLGINVAHELGHRNTWYEQLMSKALLLTSLYMHFFIEHNRGHHRYVSTPEDPASSRRGELLYAFWLRSCAMSYLSAWRLEREKLKKMGLSAIHWRNEMLWYQLIQLGLVFAVGALYGWTVMLFFLAAATMGFLLLETVNYIEHYGLRRKETSPGRYERVLPAHSWNSDHTMGRLMLFELSRHSDHHFLASRKYQILRHLDSSPQMPTGYPGMMLMALIPPLWFRVMHKRLERFQSANV